MNNEFLSFLFVAFVWGLKHGLDADHLATIDGLTRFNQVAGNYRLARICGLLFSVGHGLIVCIVAMVSGIIFSKFNPPHWLDTIGAIISSSILIILGLANLYSLIKTPPNQMVQLVGLKSKYLSKLLKTSHPVLIISIGSLFAFSFDTLSLAAMFSITGFHAGGTMYALLIGLVFTAGMVITDSANGYWIARLLKRGDQLAILISNGLGYLVVTISFLVAGITIASSLSKNVGGIMDGKELVFGIIIVLAFVITFSILVFLHFKTKEKKLLK